jgi:arabinogalactan oligomer / maltooligosaccharide transport system substrate-binding protein
VKSKRVFQLLVPLVMIMGMLLTACGTGGETGVSYKGTITIWHNWQGDYLRAKQRIFDFYMQAHPDVKIQLVNQDKLIDKSIDAVNANAGPDIIAWVDDSLGRLVKTKTVIALDQYISKDYVESTYNKAAAQGVEYNGKVWGVPESVEAITLMYNSALVKPADLPKSIDDITKFQQTFQAANPGKFGIVWNTTDAYFNAPFFYGFGGFYVHEDGKVGLNTPGGIQAAKFIAAQKPYLPTQIDYGVADTLFKEGKAAAIINGPWSYKDYSGAKIKVGFQTLPAPSTPFVGVKSLWVTKNAKNPALAADILKFYTSKSNQVSMALENKEIPANAAADDDPYVQADASIAGFATQAKLGVALPNTPYMSVLWDPTANALKAIWNGSQTPEQAVADAQTKAEGEIKKLQ